MLLLNLEMTWIQLLPMGIKFDGQTFIVKYGNMEKTDKRFIVYPQLSKLH